MTQICNAETLGPSLLAAAPGWPYIVRTKELGKVDERAQPQ